MKRIFALLVVFGIVSFVSCARHNPKMDALKKQLDSIHKIDSIDKINKERQKVADSIAKIIELKLKSEN